MSQQRNAFDVLEERGFVRQLNDVGLRDLLGREKLTFYIGFDPTGDSLHVGNYVQLMAMSHMQRAGHRPIALVGGGTAMVADPSGKSELRSMMSAQRIQANAEKMKVQMAKFLDFSEGKAILVNNADWLLTLNYVDFLRDVGVHFSVNRMLAAECYKARLEHGLTFFEFNYMLMQSYDFLHLYRNYGCTLQLGGDDQWSNILAGADLIRRVERADAYAMTFALLTNVDGSKMGKTVGGALWLDADKTSPYEFYQYWRNVDDASVEKSLSLLTYLPLEHIRELCQGDINQAKKVLAYEITALIHGATEADNAVEASEALFGAGGSLLSMPTTHITANDYERSDKLLDLMVLCGLATSKGDARRLVEGGGVTVDGERVDDIQAAVGREALERGVIIRKGKKGFHRVILG
jgi:tyrosyl-tRNA synthetase